MCIDFSVVYSINKILNNLNYLFIMKKGILFFFLLFVSLCAIAHNDSAENKNAIVVIANDLRSEPDWEQGIKIAELPKRDSVILLNLSPEDSYNGFWSKVSYKGQVGWVLNSYITLPNNYDKIHKSDNIIQHLPGYKLSEFSMWVKSIDIHRYVLPLAILIISIILFVLSFKGRYKKEDWDIKKQVWRFSYQDIKVRRVVFISLMAIQSLIIILYVTREVNVYWFFSHSNYAGLTTSYWPQIISIAGFFFFLIAQIKNYQYLLKTCLDDACRKGSQSSLYLIVGILAMCSAVAFAVFVYDAIRFTGHPELLLKYSNGLFICTGFIQLLLLTILFVRSLKSGYSIIKTIIGIISYVIITVGLLAIHSTVLLYVLWFSFALFVILIMFIVWWLWNQLGLFFKAMSANVGSDDEDEFINVSGPLGSKRIRVTKDILGTKSYSEDNVYDGTKWSSGDNGKTFRNE